VSQYLDTEAFEIIKETRFKINKYMNSIIEHPITRLMRNDRPLYMYELLLKKGKYIDPETGKEKLVDANDYDGYWHLIKTMWYTENAINIIRLLLRYGSDPDIGHVSHGPGLCYLATAIDENWVEMVELLLEYGASPYIWGIRGCGNVLRFSPKYNKYGNFGSVWYKDPDDTDDTEHTEHSDAEKETEKIKADKIEQLILKRMRKLNDGF